MCRPRLIAGLRFGPCAKRICTSGPHNGSADRIRPFQETRPLPVRARSIRQNERSQQRQRVNNEGGSCFVDPCKKIRMKKSDEDQRNQSEEQNDQEECQKVHDEWHENDEQTVHEPRTESQ